MRGATSVRSESSTIPLKAAQGFVFEALFFRTFRAKWWHPSGPGEPQTEFFGFVQEWSLLLGIPPSK